MKITFTSLIKNKAKEETMETESYSEDQTLVLKNTARPGDSKSYQSPFMLLNFYMKDGIVYYQYKQTNVLSHLS